MKNKSGGYDRTIIRALKLGEISSVDNPAQEHARLVIMKRADEVAPADVSDDFVKATFDEALRQLQIEEAMSQAFDRFWRLNSALRSTIKQILMDPKEQNPIQAVRNAAQAYVQKIEDMARTAVAAAFGANTNDDAYKAAVEKAIETGAVDAEFVKAHVAGSTGSRTQEESMDKKEQEALEKRAADAEARAQKAEAIAGMTPAVRKYYDGLAEAAQTEFLKKDAKAMEAEVTKAQDSDPVIYTCADGTEIRKSAGELTARLAKKADETEKRLAEAEAKNADQELAKRAETLIPNLGGDLEARKTMLKAVESISDETARNAALETLKSANANAATAFIRKGSSSATPESGSAEAKLDELAKKHAAENGVSFEKAYDAVLLTKEGEALYGQITAQ